MDDPALEAALSSAGPLPSATASALLERGRDLLQLGEPGDAVRYFQRVVGTADPRLTAEALLGLGDALYRLDRDADAVGAWEAVTRLPDTPAAYRAWRQIAAERVRAGNLSGATDAYRQAERRAPPEDRAEIASRLGWLNKEQGHAWSANRYFARSRGGFGAIGLAQVILAVTVAVSLLAIVTPDTTLFDLLALDRRDVVHGQLWRLLSVTLLHAGLIHLLFNMYALYLIGPIVEQIWGSRLFAAFYVLTALAASTASITFSPGPAVGASGAIFGLVGVLLAGTRVHNPMLDTRARAIVPQLGMIVVINLAFGFLAGGGIDNAAHVGGLVAGLWLGLAVPPGRVPTLRSMWQQPGGSPETASPLLVGAGILVLIAVILVGLSVAGVRI
jgi:membrane associated rhomboid family serine protease